MSANLSGNEAVAESSRDFIRAGDLVMLRLPSSVIKQIEIVATSTISLGKYGSFKCGLLIGQSYGITYEIIENEIVPVNIIVTEEIEESAANNQNIASTGASTLGFEEIQQLKKDGKSGREIIAQQIQGHSAFELKTNYSKDKYLKRKEAKFMQSFSTIEPTTHNITQYHFNKDPESIKDLRPDVLSQLLSNGNVRPGSKLLLVEDTHGLVTAACVERMGGEGELLLLNDADSPPALHILQSFNFTPKQLSVISYIHWAATQSTYVPPNLPTEISIEDVPKSKSNREQIKFAKRRAEISRSENCRNSFLAGEFDSAILATSYDPLSIIPLLLSSLAGSATISIHSTSLPLLFKTYQYLKSDPSFLSPTIIEPWLRQYQVLPGRTHPEMSGMGHGGYLLNCFRVFDDEEAISVTASGRRGPGFGKGKKRKAEEEARKEAEGKIAKFEVVEGESVESEVMVDESRIIDENMVVVDDLNLLKPDTLIEVETKI